MSVTSSKNGSMLAHGAFQDSARHADDGDSLEAMAIMTVAKELPSDARSSWEAVASLSASEACRPMFRETQAGHSKKKARESQSTEHSWKKVMSVTSPEPRAKKTRTSPSRGSVIMETPIKLGAPAAACRDVMSVMSQEPPATICFPTSRATELAAGEPSADKRANDVPSWRKVMSITSQERRVEVAPLGSPSFKLEGPAASYFFQASGR
jgi:hypothetical protein